MKRAGDPTLVDLLEARRVDVLRELDALDVAIAAQRRTSSLAPVGCDRRADGFDCSPQRWTLYCSTCGYLVRLCARHGGERAAIRELTRHEWEAHRIDDREGS